MSLTVESMPNRSLFDPDPLILVVSRSMFSSCTRAQWRLGIGWTVLFQQPVLHP